MDRPFHWSAFQLEVEVDDVSLGADLVDRGQPVVDTAVLRAGRIGFRAPIAGRLSSVVSSADCRSAALGCGGSIPSLPTEFRDPAYARGPSTFEGLYRFFVGEALTVV